MSCEKPLRCSSIFSIRENKILMKIMCVYVEKVESEEDEIQNLHFLQKLSNCELNLAMAHTK